MSEEYINYLKWKVEKKYISNGIYSLLLISKSEYDKFLFRIENDEYFKKEIFEINKKEIRDRKISEIIN